MKRHLLRLSLLLAASCSLGTSRPPFQPMPEARLGDLDVEVPTATERMAKALTDAGIPVGRVSPQDGYLETPWFDATTGRPVGGRPLGLDVVRVRGWVTPSAHGSSEIKVEAVYRPIADPSRPPRELEHSVPYAHPVREQVRAAYRAVGARITLDEPDAMTLSERRAAAQKARAPRDTTPADSVAADSVRRDSLAPPVPLAAAAADTLPPRPATPARGDTTAARPLPVRRDTSAAPAQRDPLASQQLPPAAPPPAATPAVRPAPAQPAARQPEGYSIQVAATADSAAASLAARRLGAMGIEPNIVREGGLLKVRSGAYPTRESAQTVLGRVRRSFPDAFLVR